MRGRAPGASTERDLTWLDLSSSADVSQDGKLLLFNEFGREWCQRAGLCRGTDGSPPIKLTEGGAMSLSPDGMRAMLMPRGAEVPIVPVRAGEPISVRFPVATLFYASWFPDGKRILFTEARGQMARHVSLYSTRRPENQGNHRGRGAG